MPLQLLPTQLVSLNTDPPPREARSGLLLPHAGHEPQATQLPLKQLLDRLWAACTWRGGGSWCCPPQGLPRCHFLGRPHTPRAWGPSVVGNVILRKSGDFCVGVCLPAEAPIRDLSLNSVGIQRFRALQPLPVGLNHGNASPGQEKAACRELGLIRGQPSPSLSAQPGKCPVIAPGAECMRTAVKVDRRVPFFLDLTLRRISSTNK